MKKSKLQKITEQGWVKTDLEMKNYIIYKKGNKRKVYDSVNDRVIITYTRK